MQRKIIYIVNPISGTRTKKDLQTFIEKKTAERQIPFHVYPSVANGDYTFLHETIKQENITDIVIAGGDGTVSQVVGSLSGLSLEFGIIPCGSGNGLAFAAGIPKQPEKALDIVFNGRSGAVDGFYVNDRFACMLCGLGFDAKVAHDFAKQNTRGLSTYVKQIIKNIFTAKTYSFDLTLKNQQLHLDAYFISIANSNQHGNNFTIAPKASLSDGLLDVVIVTSQNRLDFLFQTFRQVLGANPLQADTFVENKKGVIYFQTDKLKILNKDEAPVHVDGDPIETIAQLNVKVSPSHFRFIQPS